MAVRVTAAEVKAIMDGCTVLDDTVDVFIISANLTVTKMLGSDTTIGDTLLKEIERWFAAHMIASTIDRTTVTEKIGDVSVKYTGEFGKKLEATPYGQMVLQIDTSGKMAKLGKKAASIIAVTSFE